MPKILYEVTRFADESLQLIEHARRIAERYAAEGLDLTLRQLYYRFVAQNIFRNDDKNYKRLGELISKARMAGLIDWRHITDRTRYVRGYSAWNDPSEIISSAAYSYNIDFWKEQPYYVEVWIEKDALVGVIEEPCSVRYVPYFSCRGYTSMSEIWQAGQRIKRQIEENMKPAVIVHLGDHDPSGIDMSRDIEERLRLFLSVDLGFEPGEQFTVERIALNYDQIEQYRPPPNPAKLTDSRISGYIERFGTDSWELDALEPNVIRDLLSRRLDRFIDRRQWDRDAKKKAAGRQQLTQAAENWPAIVHMLNKKKK